MKTIIEALKKQLIEIKSCLKNDEHMIKDSQEGIFNYQDAIKRCEKDIEKYKDNISSLQTQIQEIEAFIKINK